MLDKLNEGSVLTFDLCVRFASKSAKKFQNLVSLYGFIPFPDIRLTHF